MKVITIKKTVFSIEGCDRGVIDCDETNFLMEGSRRKEPRRGSESIVDEMLFKSWPRNYKKQRGKIPYHSA